MEQSKIIDTMEMYQRAARSEVSEKSGGGEGIGPETGGHGCMEKKGTHTLLEVA